MLGLHIALFGQHGCDVGSVKLLAEELSPRLGELRLAHENRAFQGSVRGYGEGYLCIGFLESMRNDLYRLIGFDDDGLMDDERRRIDDETGLQNGIGVAVRIGDGEALQFVSASGRSSATLAENG